LIKNSMGAWTKASQKFFVFQKQWCMIKDFKFQLPICFNSSVIKHCTPLHKTPLSFPLFHQIQQFFRVENIKMSKYGWDTK
jgi:hypothetical protein